MRAFYRLIKNLKKDFPQLSICLLLDGLYAAGPVFDICKNHNWKYIITFKEGSMSDVYAEYMNLKPLFKETFKEITDGKIKQKFNWVTGIAYQAHSLNVLECNESNKSLLP